MAILHWKLQRLSAIILVPSIIYITLYFLNITNLTYSTIVSDITSLWGIIFIVAVSSTLFMHSSLGIETIMEDYIHNDSMQRFFINLSKAIHVILFLVTLISLSMIRGS